jgi:signal transduction histidine kinase
LRLRKVRREFRAVLSERARIAREIHDGLIQTLAGVVMQLETAQLLPSQESSQRLDRALDLARQGVQDARLAIGDLRPADEKGRLVEFSELVRQLAQLQIQNNGLSLDFQVIGSPFSLSESVQTELLRICQESFQNILKHSEASAVEVHVEYGNGILKLSIRDNGKGFDVNSDSPRGHFGLIGLRERAAQLGADLGIQSASGQGTIINISLPARPPS